MARVFNFSAGPSALPEPVLAEVQSELLEYGDTGMSVLEMSHRSAAYSQIIEDAETTLRRLVGIPDNYRVLFLQGGATLQFAGIPMNLMRTGRAGYLVTGLFSRLAQEEAEKYGTVEVLASSEATGHDRIPDLAPVAERCQAGDLDYVYICQNNTIYGTQYRELPDTGDVPLVADVSSCFLMQPLDVTRYGLVYAGAQKNAGCAGTTVVIVRDDLVGEGPACPLTPSYMSYRRQADAHSMMNTPNTFGIYLSGKVLSLGRAGRRARGARAPQPREGAHPLRLPRPQSRLSPARATLLPLDCQRHLPLRHRRARQRLYRGRPGARHRGREGAPIDGRHAREHLQRRLARGGAGAHRLHGGV